MEEKLKHEKLQKYLRLILRLKQVGKIVCVGIKTSKKDVYAGFEAGKMRELKYKSCRTKIIYPRIETGKKYGFSICRD